MNGFANVKKSAMPTPIIATASSSATTMNIFTCSIGTISGWRAAPSRKRPPSRPMPTPTPRAPKPIRIATARAVKPMTVSISFSLLEDRVSTQSLMLVREAQIHDGQHHENEGLQHDYQYVEHRPEEVQRQLPESEQCDENEYQ